jgi:copper(I)-binding protein
MTANFQVTTVLALMLGVIGPGCSDSAAALTATDVVVLAPIPGSTVAVAYLTLHNRGARPLTIYDISSSEFGNIEMHESMTVDGVARMRRLDAIALEAGASIEFAAGGKHLMLMEPLAEPVPGTPITLQIKYNDGDVLVVTAPLERRN